MYRHHPANLPPEYRQANPNRLNLRHGEGLKDILDSIGRRIRVTMQGPRSGATKRFTEFLDKEGSQRIVGMSVGRKPVEKGVERVLDALSGNAYSDKKKELGYKEAYHSYLIVDLEDEQGKRSQRTVHKNEIIEQRVTSQEDRSFEKSRITIPQDSDLTLKELINRAATTDLGKPADADSVKNFYRYDPSDANCQRFTRSIIEDNGWLDDQTPETKEFLEPQDSKALVGSLGALSFIPKLITDTAATLDRTRYGDGLLAKAVHKRSSRKRGSGLAQQANIRATQPLIIKFKQV